MAEPKDGPSFFRKVVQFVANPATDWAELNSRQGDSGDAELEKSELKAMVERKRRNDFVRKRELDMLRRLRREGLSPEQLAALGGSSHIDESDVRVSETSLRQDKRVKAKIDEITIFFKRPPHVMFPMQRGAQLAPNYLSICIQPDEGIQFSFQAKVPDTVAEMRTVDMSFQYEESFGALAIPEAYERLLLDVIKGDASLFTRSDAIEHSWALIDPILEGWESKQAPPLCFYESGTWGPVEADALIAHDGYHWTLGCAPEE